MEDPRKKTPSLGTSGKHPLVPVKAFIVVAVGFLLAGSFLVDSDFGGKRDKINANLVSSAGFAVSEVRSAVGQVASLSRFGSSLSGKVSSVPLAGAGLLSEVGERAAEQKEAVERVEIRLPLPKRVALWNNLGYRLREVGEAMVPGVTGFDATTTIVSLSAEENTISLGQIVLGFWYDLKHLGGAAIDKIIAGWDGFLGRKGETILTNATSTAGTASVQDLATLKEQVKREVYEQLKREMLAGQGGYATESRDYQGFVVYPADAVRKEGGTEANDIKNSFSDKVQIKFDSSRRSGIITPIFRNTLGKDYIFVITPINPR